MQDEAESTEIMPIQFRSVSPSATPLPFDSPGLSITAPRTTTDNVGIPLRQPHTRGDARRASIYPNVDLVDEPVVEEEEEVDEESKEDKFFVSAEEEELAAGIYRYCMNVAG